MYSVGTTKGVDWGEKGDRRMELPRQTRGTKRLPALSVSGLTVSTMSGLRVTHRDTGRHL